MTVTVFHFWSQTCGPCRTIKPALEDLKEEFDGQIEWISIDTHNDPKGASSALRITVVPTIVVVRDGVETGRQSGTQVSIFYSLIQKALAMR